MSLNFSQMTPEQKWKLAKRLVFAGWAIVLTLNAINIALHVLHPHEHQYADNDPWFVILGAAFCLVLMLMGLWIGSRGIGNPLSVRSFFSLLLGFPSSLIVAPCLAISFGIAVVETLGFGSASGIIVGLILAIGVGIVVFEILRLR